MDFDFSKLAYQELVTQRATYLLSTTAPLDGMWENAFFPAASHWKITHNARPIGSCSINADGKMLGFDVQNSALQRFAFAKCVQQLDVSGAFASTAEPVYLTMCADHQTSMSVNALMYAETSADPVTPVRPRGMNIRTAVPDDLETAVSFGVAAIQANRDWLATYFQERIQQNELFGLWRGSKLAATGECRISPIQKGVADVGMIVGVAERKKGLATFMLQYLRSIGAQKDLKLICSTESSNIAAQKAIEKAGFASQHRILSFTF